MRGAQLAAGRRDVLSLALADNGRDVAVPERALEGEDTFFGGSLPGRALPGIIDDEVELATHAGHQARQLGRVFRAVVDAAEQEIFKGDALARLERIRLQRGQKLIQRPAGGPGHDALAQGLIGRVQRDRQIGEPAFAQLAQALADAAGGNGDAPWGKVQAPVVIEAFQRVPDGGPVEQGLAHAHEDEVAQHGPVRPRVAQMFARHQDLPKDLAHAEVARKAHPACGAKGAGHGAAHLRGKALAPAAAAVARFGGDEHALHQRAVLHAQEELDRAVAAFLRPRHFGPLDARAAREALAAGARDVAHALEVAGHLAPQPLPELDGPEFRLMELVAHPVDERGQREVQKIDTFVGRRAHGPV